MMPVFTFIGGCIIGVILGIIVCGICMVNNYTEDYDDFSWDDFK